MNKVFKVIWNHATQTWVAVSELTQAKGKTKSSSTAKAAAAAVAIAASSVAGVASAATTSQPAGNNAGNVYVSTSDNQTMLGQNITIGKDGLPGNISTDHATTVAIGTNLSADGYGSIIIGDGARTERQVDPSGVILHTPETDPTKGGNPQAKTASNGRSVSIGFNTLARAQSVAIGVNSSAELNNTIAIGTDARATTAGAVALGNGAQATAFNTAAFGDGAKATAQNAYALGPQAHAIGGESVAVGAGAYASNNEAIAIGVSSHAMGNVSRAIGRAGALDNMSTAVGYNAYALDQGAIAFGSNAPGRDPSGAHERVRKKYAALGKAYQPQTANYTPTLADGAFALAFGSAATAYEVGSTVFGGLANADGKLATAVGYRSNALSSFAGAFGGRNVVGNGYGGAVGKGNAEYSYAIGYNNNIQQKNTFVLGRDVTTTQSNSVVLGAHSKDRAETVENDATVNGISYSGFAGNKKDDGSPRTVADNAGIVSVGKPNAERQIINVAPGKIAADSTDAINGSQLYLTQHALGNVAATTANHLGGGSTVNPDGNLTAPSYELVVGNPQAGNNNTLAGQNPANNPAISNTVKPATNVGDALSNLNAYVNQGFKVRENGGADKATVTPGEAVNFINGKGTTASVTAETPQGVTDVTFNVDFGTITNKVDGKAFTPDTDANAPKVASTKMVQDAINDSGFNLKVDKATGSKNSKATDGGDKLVKTGEEVVFKAGDNIELTRAGKEITIASKPKFSIATDNDGSKQINSGDTINFAASDDGLADFKLDTGSGTIKPQLKKLATAPIINNKNNPKQGAVRTQTEGNNAGIEDHLVTGARLAEAVNNSYWRANINKTGSGDAVPATNDAQIKAGDKVEFIAGNGMKIEIDESNRQFTFSLKTDDIPAPETATLTVTTTPDGQNGNVNTVPDDDKNKLVTAGNVAEVINQSGWNLAGKGADGNTNVATTVNPSDKVSFNNSDTADVVINTDNKANPTVTVNVKTAEVAADPAADKKGKVKVNVPQGGDETAENKKLATAKTVADAVNAAGFIASIARDDADFADQDGDDNELINPGDKVTYQAGKNLKVKQQTVNGETKFTYATKDNVVFKDVNTETLTIGGPKGTTNNQTPADKPRADISVVNGPTDLAGQPTDKKTRIQYTPVNPDGTNGTPENLATLKDGLKFKGNDATKVISKPLNSTLSVEGALPANTDASAKNVRVDVEGTGDDAKLVVKIAEKPEFKGVTLKDGDAANPNTVNMAPTAPNTLTLTGGDNNAPVTLDGLKTTLPGTADNNNPAASETARSFTPTADQKNDAATIDDVVNAGWNLKANNQAVDFVKPFDTVEFINGDGISIEHIDPKQATHNKLQISVNKGTLKAEDGTVQGKPKGSLSTPDAATDKKFATTGDIVDAVNKSGWNISGKTATGQAADGLVNPGDKVTFGSSDTADIALDVTNADNPTVTVNVKTADIGKETKTDPANPAQSVPTGKVELTTKPNATAEEKAAEGKKLVNADTVVNAINNAGFTATVGTDTAADKLTFANEAGKADALINPGDKVVYQAGKNMKVKQEQDGNTTKFTYATEDNVHFNSVTVQTDGPDNKAGSPITMVSLPSTDDADNTNTLAFLGRDPQDQTKTAPVKIVNVESGLKPYAAPNAAENPAPFKAAEGLINLNTPNIDDSNVVTAGDLRKMGWVVEASNTPSGFEKAVKNAQKVDIRGTGGVKVIGSVQPDGHYRLDVSLEESSRLVQEFKAGMKPGEVPKPQPTGRVSIPDQDPGAGFVSANDVASAINNTGFKANIGRNDEYFADQTGKGTNDQDANDRDLVIPGDKVNYLAGKNLKVKREFSKDGQDGIHNFTFATDENVEFSTVKVATKVRDENTGDVVAEGSPITLVSLPSTDDVDNTNTLAFMGTTPDGKKPAPVTLTNIKSNLPDAYNKGDKVIGADGYPTNDDAAAPTKSVTGPTAVEAAEMHNKAATVGDVLNAGFNIQANGKEADFVKPYDTVNFADGTGTTVEFVPSEDGKVNTIKVNTVMAYTDENGNKVAKADDDKFYPVNPATGKPDTSKPAVENPQVNVVNADGSTTKPTVLGNVAQGAKTYGPNLAQPTDINSPKAVEMAKNVSAAYEGLADLNSSNPTNVMTVADAKNMGWVVSTLHGNNYAADVRNANHVDFVGTGLATVKGHTDKDTGIRVITVDVNSQNVVQDAQLPVVYTNTDGDKVIKVGDKFYKDADVTVFDGNVYPKDSVVAADGKVYPAGTELGDNNLPTDNTVAAIKPLADGDKVVDPNTIIASMNNGNNDTKVPMPLANVGGNLPNTYNKGDKTVVDADGQEAVYGGKPTGDAKAKADKEGSLKGVKVEDVFNNAATVGDVLNSGFNVQANGEAADFVKPYDTVNFVDGKGTLASVETDDEGKVTNVTFNVDTGKVTATDKGDVTGPVKAAEDALKAAKDALAQDPDNQDLKDAVKKAEGDVVKAGNQVATAQNVADAINNSGWNIKGTDENGEAFTKLVKPGSQVSFQDGKGTKAITDVDSEGNPFVKIDIDADSVADSITKGDINIVKEGDKAGTVAPKAGDENKLVTAKEVADAINGSGWTATIGRDDSYFVDQAGEDKPQLINPGETVSFNSGKNLKVKQDGNNITYDLADDLDIHTANIGGPGKDGKPGKDGSVNVKAEDGKSGVAIDGKDASVTASGKDGASVAINGQDGSIGLKGPKGDDGKDGLGATLKIGAGPAGVDGKDGFDGIPGKDGENGKPRIVYTPIDPATGKPAVDKDGKPVEEKVATLNDGLKFKGNNGEVIVKKLNETIEVVGELPNDKPASAKNVRVDNQNGKLTVKIAETPEFKGVELDNTGNKDNAVNITNNSAGDLQVGGKDGKAVKVTNVAPGRIAKDSKDAINGSQLHQVAGDIHNKINRNNKDLRAGIAGANAAAGLPQVYIPGKSMVAASAGTFKGQSAVAVGYSRASDNGKLILKLQGNANSRGDFGGSVGVGYQW